MNLDLDLVNAVLAFVVLFAIVAAIAVDWRVVWVKWHPFLIAVAVEQAIVAYGSWVAYRSPGGGGHPALLLTLSLCVLLAAAAFVIQGRHDRRETLDDDPRPYLRR